ncbi:MAG: murein L,D-transpeptidase [Epsilonproteobacteria bacterium]|nr:MAG: murein L,D-transpeptidase [Campylobacterota bacterium]
MVGIRANTIKLYLSIWISFFFLYASSLEANNNLDFRENASTLIMNSLKEQEKDSFLYTLYAAFFFMPLWVQAEKPSSLAQTLFKQIQEDQTLALHSKLKQDAYALADSLKVLYGSESSLLSKVELEFKISQLYKGYADYALYGSINWDAFQKRLHSLKSKDIHASWLTYKPKISPLILLKNAVVSSNLENIFKDVKPKSYHYDMLYDALIKYIKLEKIGGWENITLGKTLRKGDSHKAIALLRKRLRISGDYKYCDASQEFFYDSCLKEAVIGFQKRHGLISKGVIGKKTVAALNIPIEIRIRQMRLNLDRIKWLYAYNEERHIIINIPSFMLFFERNKLLQQQMKVIVGKKRNPTPIFSNRVKTIVLNPYWNIPKSIIQKEMIPELIKNPEAMEEQGIEIRAGWGKDAGIVDAYSFDWSQYRYSQSMPFRFAQVPGRKNALGKVKFLFPNQFAVYMHDTPNKKLFKRNVRAFSHGCIRLARPRDLLETFSTFNDAVDFETSKEKLKGRKRSNLKLNQQVPIDIVYLTAYVDYAGILQFRNDIYGYDRMQLQAYRKW